MVVISVTALVFSSLWTARGPQLALVAASFIYFISSLSFYQRVDTPLCSRENLIEALFIVFVRHY